MKFEDDDGCSDFIESPSSTKNAYFCEDEVEFYTDLAMNECQRWIEGVTRERFLDEDDFLYSLKHGTQLRKILCQIIPEASSYLLCPPVRPSYSSLYDDDTGSETSSEDIVEDWVHQFLRVCIQELHLERDQLFWTNDLVADIDEIGREGRFPLDTLQKIRRVVVTIYELASKLEDVGCRKTSGRGSRFDSSALEPLVKYHYCLSEEEGRIHPWFTAEAEIRDSRLKKDVNKTINKILDHVCDIVPLTSPIDPSSSATSGFCGDETFEFPPVCMDASVSEKVHRYLSELPEDQLSDSETRSSCVSPDFYKKSISGREEKIPTRHIKVEGNSVPHDPLKFVAVSGATSLAESAKQKIRLSEESKKMKEATEWKIKEHEEDSEWVNNLDSWKEKRKKSLSSSTLKAALEGKENKEEFVPRKTSLSKIDFRPKYADDESLDEYYNVSHTAGSGFSQRGHDENYNEDKSDDNKSPSGILYQNGEAEQPSDLLAFSENRESLAKREENPKPVDVRGAGEETHLHHLVTPGGATLSQTMPSAETVMADSGLVNGGELAGKLARASMEDSGHFGTETEDSEQNSPNSQISSTSEESKASRTMRRVTLHDESDEGEDQPPPIRSAPPPIDAEPGVGMSPTNHPGKQSAYDKLRPFTDPGVQRNPLEYLTPYQEEVEVIDSGVELNRGSPSPSRDSRESLSPRSQTSTANGHHGQYRERSRSTVYASQPTSRSVSREGYNQDDKPQMKWRYQQKEINKTYDDFTVVLEASSKGDRGFGLSVKGGRDKRQPVKIDGVILGGAADKARVLVGDEILFINGEDVSNKFLAKVNMIIRESQRLGEMELVIRRTHYGDSPTLLEKSPVRRSPSPRAKATFDEKRSVFSNQTQSEDGFSRFKKNRRQMDFPRYNPPVVKASSVAASGNGRSKSVDEPVNSARRQAGGSPILQRLKQPGKIENFVPEVEREMDPKFDYRVSSLQRNPSPGRILDFVPEIERRVAEATSLKPQGYRETEQDIHWRKEKEYVMSKRGGVQSESSYLRPSSRSSDASSSGGRSGNLKSPSPTRNYSIDGHMDTGRLMVNTHSRDNSGIETASGTSHLSPASSHLTSSPGADKEKEHAGVKAYESHDSISGLSLLNEPSHVTPDQEAEKFVRGPVAHSSVLQSEKEKKSMVEEQPKPFSHVKKGIVFSSEPLPGERRPATAYYPPLSQQLKPQLVQKDPKSLPETVNTVPYQAPIPRAVSPLHRRVGSNDDSTHLTPQRQKVSPMNSYDSANPGRGRRDLVYDSEIERQTTELQYMNLAAQVEQEKTGRNLQQDRRNVQAHPMPRMSVDTQDHWLVKEAEDRRLSQQMREQRSPRRSAEHAFSAGGVNGGQREIRDQRSPRLRHDGAVVNGHYQNLPLHPPQTRGGQHHSPRAPQDSASLERRPPAPPSLPPPLSPSSLEPSDQDQVVSVSGRQKCSHCSDELGRGAAMIIESLNLFYHLDCFRCYVCSVALGNGAQGADVRIRAGKLHCQSCYSNDEVGLKFSEV